MSAARIVLGTAQWGLPYGIANRTGVPDDRAVSTILAVAKRAGIATLDTARAYGESESVIGRLIGEDPTWTVVTKVPPLRIANATDAGAREQVQRALDASRDALGRAHLDVVLLHDATDRTAARGVAWRALVDHRTRGTIGSLGVSASCPGDAMDVLADDSVEVVQVATSLLDARLSRVAFFARAARKGKRVFVRSAFLQGVAHLAPEALPAHLSELKPVLGAVARWAAGRGMGLADAFLLYLRDALTAPVVLGIETPAQLEANLRTWTLPPLGAVALAELTALVPELPDSVLDPSMWPPSLSSRS